MSYEEEQEKCRKQLSTINYRIETLDTLLTNNPNLRKDLSNDPQRDYYNMILRTNYGYYSELYDSSYVLEYKLCQYKKIELESKLRQTQSSRNVIKTLDYLDGITPKHVSGRVYEVKDGNGCGTFLLWFFIIDAIIIFFIFLADKN